MEQKRANRHLLAILIVGVLACGAAFGFRMFRGKSVVGTWKGYAYQRQGSSYIADKTVGEFMIVLKSDGEYYENGNETSGTWAKKDNRIVLSPTLFYGRSPEENRARYRKKDGTTSVTIERLLKIRMQPMTVEYRPLDDHLVFEEPTIHYEYERL